MLTQTSFCEDSSGDLVKRRLFSQANFVINYPFPLKQILEIVTPCYWLQSKIKGPNFKFWFRVQCYNIGLELISSDIVQMGNG